MTRFEFKRLSKTEQFKTLSQYGEFVAERIEGGSRYYLYVLNCIYVELIHNLTDLNNKGLEINQIFEDSAPLAVYSDYAEAI